MTTKKKLAFLSLCLLTVAVPLCYGAIDENWQTVFPDTMNVLPLFGDRGPRWHLISQDGSYAVPASIPGDVLTDLMNGGVLDDPYFDRNFVTQRHIWNGAMVTNVTQGDQLEPRTRVWCYVIDFEYPTFAGRELILVVEGMKMGAYIHLDDRILLGEVTDQFLRYQFSITKALEKDRQSLSTARRYLHHNRKHKLRITFDPAISTEGRFQACSGGWDWAPYTRTGDNRGSRTFSLGVWKHLYIIEQHKTSITYVVPKVTYLGDEVDDYPRKPMMSGPDYDFQVEIDVHLNAPDPDGLVFFRGNFTDQTVSVSASSTVVSASLIALKDDIALWWPRSSRQPLYTVEVSYRSTDGYQTEWISKTIGFRTIDLITINDTDPNELNRSREQEGSGSHGMFFRVNGASIWARGANVIPMDQLEGRLSDEAHRIMVRSAAEAGMNMLRVWGGGQVMPESFYKTCDELGIMVYQDMMLVEQSNHGAINTTTMEKEIRHVVRSLAHHPSIAMWSGCNECSVEMDTKYSIYASFVMQTVGEEDPTRPLWPSCPARHGWKTGVMRINGKPNGRALETYTGKEAKPSHAIERHGPYRHGYSEAHPSVNSVAEGGFGTNCPPTLRFRDEVGPQHLNAFVSEFGVSTWSSFESISATLSPSEWSLHGAGEPDVCTHVRSTNFNICTGTNVLAERNYVCDNLIEAYFGVKDLDVIDKDAFKAQLFMCMMSTTLWLKGQIEIMRATNSFGTLIWQLNENWPTGGWGTIEYGSNMAQKGQVIGGRWKPIMHLLKQALFRDVFATCGMESECFIRNDGIDEIPDIILELEMHNLDSGEMVDFSTIHFEKLDGGSHIERFPMVPQTNSESDVLVMTARSSDKILFQDHIVLFAEPMLLSNTRRPNITISTPQLVPDASATEIVLLSDHPAIHVVLTSIAQGHFEENSVFLRKGVPKTVRFLPHISSNTIDPHTLVTMTRVEHLLSYV